MLAAVLTLALAAEPVLAVPPFKVSGASQELGLAMQSIIEDDLIRVSGAVRTEADIAAAKAGGPMVRAANYLVMGSLLQMGKSGRLTLKVVNVASHRAMAATSFDAGDGKWGADRSKVIREVCDAAGLVISNAELTTPIYTPELVAAWGKALAKGTPAAIAEVAKQWPDFGPAKRRLAK